MASPVWASPSRISRGVGIRSFVFLGGEVPSPTPMQNYKKHKLKKELLILTLSLQKSSVLQKIIFVHLKKKSSIALSSVYNPSTELLDYSSID